MQTDLGVSDIVAGDWVDRRLPPGLRPYARVMRLDRPIGTWLLLLPCWWGLALAAAGLLQGLWYGALFALGAVVMRSAGCIVNDLADRSFDRRVARTATRPLASGALSVPAALVLLAVLLVVGLGVLLAFNQQTLVLGCAALGLVFAYPFAKRVMGWPQLILGLAFNWGILLGWTATGKDLTLPVLCLYAAGVCWTLAYDTIYACQDKKDDAALGLRSLALWLGAYVRVGVLGFYLVFLCLLAVAGWMTAVQSGFYYALCLVAGYALALWQRWDPLDNASSLATFRANRNVGLLVFLALLGGAWA